MRILINGSRGFIGSHLLNRLRSYALTYDVMPWNIDITDAAAVANDISTILPDVVIHLAGLSSHVIATKNPERAWSVNLHGALNVGAAIMHSKPNARLVFASTSEIYTASVESGRIDEHYAIGPRSTYGATKAAADIALGALAQEGLRLTRLRSFNSIGPNQNERFVVSSLARQIALIRRGLAPPVVQIGSIDISRDFLDVRDLCNAYAICLDQEPETDGRIFNICCGRARTIESVARDLAEIADVDIEIVSLDNLRRSGENKTVIGNAELFSRTTGWRPEFLWDQTLKDTLDCWLKPDIA